MTIHSAKGLEFKAVFVVGLEEELFPNQCAQVSPREMEEERRLFYVAITRAKDFCVLSYSKTRYHYGTTEYHEPSRFITEIDSQYLSQGGGTMERPAPRSGGMFAGTNKSSTLFSSQSERGGYGRQQPFGTRTSFSSYGGAENRQPTQHTATPYVGRSNLQRVSDVARNAYAPSAAKFAIGALVQHDRFGVGEVLSVEGSGENAKAVINFKNAGRKTLLLKFAKLKTIE